MKALLFSLAMLAALLTLPGCTITEDGLQGQEVVIADVFPPSKTVASYRQLVKPAKMGAAELEEHIGGKLKYAVLKKWSPLSTQFADYGIPDRPPIARISVTEIGSKMNAYGAYTNLRAGLLDEKNYIKIGVHGTVDAERLLFVQDRFLICVRELQGLEDPARRTLLINFARVISDRMPKDITDVKLIGFLPHENRVAASERLDKEDPLGLGVLKGGGVSALYRVENREARVFMAEAPEGMGQGDLLKEIRKVMEKEGPVTELSVGEAGLRGKLLKTNAAVARRQKVLFGAYGTMGDDELQNLLAGIDALVKPYKPPAFKEREKEDTDEPKNPARR